MQEVQESVPFGTRHLPILHYTDLARTVPKIRVNAIPIALLVWRGGFLGSFGNLCRCILG